MQKPSFSSIVLVAWIKEKGPVLGKEDTKYKLSHEVAENPLLRQLGRTSNGKGVEKIIGIFEQLQLPLPQRDEEFMHAHQGAIVFLTRYGLTLRIENVNKRIQKFKNPFFAAPLKSIQADDFVVEICAGMPYRPMTDEDMSFLKEQFQNASAVFYDPQRVNAAYTPVKTPSFPNGVPIVIDRGAVVPIGQKPRVKVAVAKEHARLCKEVQEEMDAFYGPAIKAFEDAWPSGRGTANAKKMRQAWAMAESFVAQGKLVAGWMDENSRTACVKPGWAYASAKAYDMLLEDVASKMTAKEKRYYGVGM